MSSDLVSQEEPAPDDSKPPKQPRFRDLPDVLAEHDPRTETPITHGELIDKIRVGRQVIDCVIETVPRDNDNPPFYLLFLSCNFQPRGFRIYRVGNYDRPRFFRDVDRLLTLVRNEFFYTGVIKLQIRQDPETASRRHKRSGRPKKDVQNPPAKRTPTT